MQPKRITLNKPDIMTIGAVNRFTLALNIFRYTTDANGTVLEDAAIPLSEKKPFPFHLFGNYDFQGGYFISDNAIREKENTILFSVYTVGLNTPLFYFNPFASINTKLIKGDVVFVYVDDFNNPSYYTFIIIRANGSSYGSLMSISNTSQINGAGQWGMYKIWDIRYTAYTQEQIYQPFLIIETRKNMGYKFDTIDPSTWYAPDFQGNSNFTIDMPIEILLNQHVGLSGFLRYGNEQINLSFTVYI